LKTGGGGGGTANCACACLIRTQAPNAATHPANWASAIRLDLLMDIAVFFLASVWRLLNSSGSFAKFARLMGHAVAWMNGAAWPILLGGSAH